MSTNSLVKKLSSEVEDSQIKSTDNLKKLETCLYNQAQTQADIVNISNDTVFQNLLALQNNLTISTQSQDHFLKDEFLQVQALLNTIITNNIQKKFFDEDELLRQSFLNLCQFAIPAQRSVDSELQTQKHAVIKDLQIIIDAMSQGVKIESNSYQGGKHDREPQDDDEVEKTVTKKARLLLDDTSIVLLSRRTTRVGIYKTCPNTRN